MFKKGLPLFLIAFSSFLVSFSQTILRPGFDPKEYADILSLAYFGSSIPDSNERKTAKDPYEMAYRSPEVGLLNQWSLYLREDNLAVINLRGTVNKPASWVANFYAAMVPATGKIRLTDSTEFEYQFAANPLAMVHVGWTLGVAHLGPDIEEKINDLFREKGIREYIISGHSQGGALAILMRSWLEYEKKKGKIPHEIIFKTYGSAAPKPGNMFYVYDYDFITRNGWAFTIVNSADWVPETPLSIQRVNDSNPTNPLNYLRNNLKKQKFIVRLAGRIVFDKLEKKPRKAQRKLERYLGALMYKRGVKKYLPGLIEPAYSNGNNYMRAGIPIILMPDEEYHEKFPEVEGKYFTHHTFVAYYYLLKKWYLQVKDKN